ncbi:MFS transporter [Nocardia higoensis]|uniref:MFS transporter n=1 Tax=Nocardia higoensis TaxID=228599 RepID=A0ABS0D9Z5_9NOCA|nr:MFS transporter [Nocardia higoensis]MBF6354467.1 MFS transporter [Nocardia higoensis]
MNRAELLPQTYLSRRRRQYTLIAVAAGVVMVSLDGTIVHIANPTIGRDLGSSLTGLQWVTNGYLLTLAVTMIIGGKLGDRFGRRRVFVVGVIGFALASLGCGLSTSTPALITFRVLQGLAGAMLVPNTLAILRSTFPPAELNRAIGTWGAASAFAAAAGPIVGGLLVEYLSWSAIFLLNVPIGLITAAVTVRWVDESRTPDRAGKVDTVGAGLLAAALFAVVWTMTGTPNSGWVSGQAAASAVAALILLAGFVTWQHRGTAPLLPLSLFRSRTLSVGVVLLLSGNIALYGVLFSIGLYMQNVNGHSPLETGIRLLPLMVVFTVSSPLGGMMTEKWGSRWPLALGMTLLAVSFAGLASLSAQSSYHEQWPWLILLGSGMGIIVVAATEAIVGTAPIEHSGVAGGLQTTASQLGGVLGTAVFGTVIATIVARALPSELHSADVPEAVSGQVIGQSGLVEQGIAPVTAQMGDTTAAAVTRGTELAFMSGMQAVMWIGVGLALVSALLALLIQPNGTQTAAEPTEAA